MTGPEHYREAEQLLSLATDYEQDGAPQTAARCRTEAKVHATLALAAATALRGGEGRLPLQDANAWFDTASGAVPRKSAYEAEAGESE